MKHTFVVCSNFSSLDFNLIASVASNSAVSLKVIPTSPRLTHRAWTTSALLERGLSCPVNARNIFYRRSCHHCSHGFRSACASMNSFSFKYATEYALVVLAPNKAVARSLNCDGMLPWIIQIKIGRGSEIVLYRDTFLDAHISSFQNSRRWLECKSILRRPYILEGGGLY